MINLTPTTKKPRAKKLTSDEAFAQRVAKFSSRNAKKESIKSTPIAAPKPHPRTIAEVASANRGQDVIAILHDKSSHIATKMMAMGVKVLAGDNWDRLVEVYEAALSAEKLRRGKPNGIAQLARGAEGEVHSRLAAAASRKGQPKAKLGPDVVAKVLERRAAGGGMTKAAKNKAPSAGQERTYKVNKKANEAKPDSWRYHMTAMIMGSTNTAAAKAAHAKSGKFPQHKLAFTWAAGNGFITFA